MVLSLSYVYSFHELEGSPVPGCGGAQQQAGQSVGENGERQPPPAQQQLLAPFWQLGFSLASCGQLPTLISREEEGVPVGLLREDATALPATKQLLLKAGPLSMHQHCLDSRWVGVCLPRCREHGRARPLLSSSALTCFACVRERVRVCVHDLPAAAA